MSFSSCARNKKLIYALEPITPTTWKEPIPMRISAMPISAEIEVQQFGALVNSYYRMNGSKKEIGHIKYQVSPVKLAWRFYIDKEPPKVHDPYQAKADCANFEAEMPRVVLNRIEIMLKRLQGK